MIKSVNLLTEQKLLGNIIRQPEIWYEIATDFRAELFSDQMYRAIAEVMIELAEGGKRPSSVQLYKAFREKGLDITPEDLTSVIASHITVQETKALQEELEDLYKRRVVYRTLRQTMDKLSREDKETDVLIAEAQQAMIEAFDKTGKGELQTMHNVAEQLFERQQRIQEGEELPTYPVSLRGVQTALGGYEAGSLNIIAGRPSMGKTSYMLNDAVFWAKQDLAGIIFSLEQEALQIGRRNLANIKKIPVNYMRRKMDEKHLDKFYSGLTELRELPIKISDRRGLTVEQICSLARVEKMRTPNLKWIAIDYLTLIKYDSRLSAHAGISGIVKTLRDLAGELGVFIILLAQLSRGVESRSDKRPMMSDLRESGSIEEVADSIIFLYREGYYKPGFLGVPEGDLIVEINLAKSREGGISNNRPLAMFNMPYMHWIDCPNEWSERYAAAINKGRR